MPHNHKGNRALVFVLLVLWFATPIARAQVADPYTVPELGVTVLLPEGTKAESQFISGGRAKSILRDPDNTWVIQIFNAVSSNPNLTIPEILDNFEQQRRDALKAYVDANPNMFDGATPDLYTDDALGRSPLVVAGRMEPDQLTIGEQGAGRFYCETPLIRPNIVTGYTVFRQSAGTFIIFQLDCVSEVFPKAKQTYETIVASATFENSEAARVERATAILSGKAFLASISNEDIEAVLLDEPVYQRLYKPAPTGLPSDAEELGWQRMQIRIGQRGELDPRKPKNQWTSADREFGYLVKTEGQIFNRGMEFEIQAVYFLDRERINEAISIHNTVRKDGRVLSVSETTVIRRNKMMTCTFSQTGKEVQTLDWALQDGYISLVELVLLPRLVALKTPENSQAEFDFGFYHFHINRTDVLLRRDKFSNVDLVTGWEHLIKQGPDDPEFRETLDLEGNLIRREMSDGKVMENITAEELRAIHGK